MSHQRSLLAETPLGPVAYAEAGPAKGPPLVLLHANPGDRRDFDAVAPALARTHRVIAVDWPGYGDSPAPADPAGTSAMHFAELLSAFVDTIGLAPAIFVGNSVGGYAAARLAIDRPEKVRALVLIDPGGFTPHNALTRAFCAFQGQELVSRLAAGPIARLYLSARTPTVLEMIARTDENHADPARVAVHAALWRSFAHAEHDLRERAGAIRQPTLLAWGKYDPLLPAFTDGKVARARLPHAQWALFDTGHAPHAEAPADFLSAVEPFLAALPAS